MQYVYAPQAPAEGVEAGVTVDASGNAVISGVENIGNYAFANRTDITSVYISADVQTIGSYAFSGCINLKTVVFEAGSPLQSIGTYAFADCTSLESIALPTTENFKSLPNSIFNGCSSLTSVTLPTNLTSVGTYAFADCTSLQSVSLPASISSFGDYMFNGCTMLSDVNFNGNTTITALGDRMFRNCTSLTNITLPVSLNFLGVYTFQGSGLTSIDLTELTGLTCFGTSATSCSATSSVYLFADCANLAEVKLPSTLTKFGGYIFQNCTSLTSFDLTGLTQIGRNCFQNTGLTSVAVPSSVNTDIGNYAFADCAALSSVTIAEGVTGVGTNTFQNCTQIAEIHLPSTVDTIGNYAFNGCTSLVSINIPAAVSKLGTYVFQNCTSLAEVTFDEGSALTQFGNYCFDGCISLTSIDLPETVTFLGQYTFRGCGLVEIDLSALTGLTRIASTATTTSVTSNIYTFADCKSLTRVVLPEGLTLIAGYVFDGCENLSSINLDNVEKFGNRVFTGTALTSVNLSVNLSSMGYLVFAGCPYLESVNVPSNCVAFSSEDGVLYNADGEIVCFPAGKEVEGGVLTLEEGGRHRRQRLCRLQPDRRGHHPRRHYGDRAVCLLRQQHQADHHPRFGHPSADVCVCLFRHFGNRHSRDGHEHLFPPVRRQRFADGDGGGDGGARFVHGAVSLRQLRTSDFGDVCGGDGEHSFLCLPELPGARIDRSAFHGDDDRRQRLLRKRIEDLHDRGGSRERRGRKRRMDRLFRVCGNQARLRPLRDPRAESLRVQPLDDLYRIPVQRLHGIDHRHLLGGDDDSRRRSVPQLPGAHHRLRHRRGRLRQRRTRGGHPAREPYGNRRFDV